MPDRSDVEDYLAWVNLEAREVKLPPGIVKNRKALIFPLSEELVALLKRKCQADGRVFETKELPARTGQSMC